MASRRRIQKIDAAEVGAYSRKKQVKLAGQPARYIFADLLGYN